MVFTGPLAREHYSQSGLLFLRSTPDVFTTSLEGCDQTQGANVPSSRFEKIGEWKIKFFYFMQEAGAAIPPIRVEIAQLD